MYQTTNMRYRYSIPTSEGNIRSGVSLDGEVRLEFDIIIASIATSHLIQIS